MVTSKYRILHLSFWFAFVAVYAFAIGAWSNADKYLASSSQHEFKNLAKHCDARLYLPGSGQPVGHDAKTEMLLPVTLVDNRDPSMKRERLAYLTVTRNCQEIVDAMSLDGNSGARHTFLVLK